MLAERRLKVAPEVSAAALKALPVGGQIIFQIPRGADPQDLYRVMYQRTRRQPQFRWRIHMVRPSRPRWNKIVISKVDVK